MDQSPGSFDGPPDGSPGDLAGPGDTGAGQGGVGADVALAADLAPSADGRLAPDVALSPDVLRSEKDAPLDQVVDEQLPDAPRAVPADAVTADAGCVSGTRWCDSTCIPEGQACNGGCLPGAKVCGTSCISTSSCCNNGQSGCPGCQTCNGGICQATANGLKCGTDMVCNQGSCTPCVAGGACSANPCMTSAWDCSTGIRLCAETPKMNGTSCGNPTCQGSNRVTPKCNGNGLCVNGSDPCSQTCYQGQCDACGLLSDTSLPPQGGCCPDGTCAMGLVCVGGPGGSCEFCGQHGDRCCLGNTCNPGLTCQNTAPVATCQ
jgi:hypothetical protein